MCHACGEQQVQVCDECRRACALKWFSGISRHPESIEAGDVVCLICEDGSAIWCGLCWAKAVAEQRKILREQSGRTIGLWPSYPDATYADEVLMQSQRELRHAAEEIARLKADLEART
jgi:hypothetical protein